MIKSRDFVKLGMILLVLVIFSASAHAENISIQNYLYDSGFEEVDDDFSVMFRDNDNTFNEIELRFDIDIGSYTKLDDVELDLKIDDFYVVCDSSEYYDEDLNFSFLSENGYRNAITNIQFFDQDCDFVDYEDSVNLGDIIDDESAFFDIDTHKILTGRYDYKLDLEGDDVAGEAVEYTKKADITITHQNNLEIDIRKDADDTTCEDDSLSYLLHETTFDLFFYEEYESCELTIKPKDSSDQLKRSFFTDNDEDALYKQIKITSQLDKRIEEPGYYVSLECMNADTDHDEILYYSYVKLPFDCEYDDTIIEDDVDSTEDNTIDNESTINATDLPINQTDATDVDDSIDEPEEKGFFAKLFDWFFGWFS